MFMKILDALITAALRGVSYLCLVLFLLLGAVVQYCHNVNELDCIWSLILLTVALTCNALDERRIRAKASHR